MRLLSVTLAGFKTFGRPTEIGFDEGVTAVVGPNGSGKSNVVDAFRWVLGESSARDLRGRVMEEVIYAGGSRRARSASAEVTITIDNSDHRLRVDYEVVEITRRLERGAPAAYYLNSTRIRRRDLLDLLASTGLTVDSYSIINQSDIERIVACSPEERRSLLEEAAQVGEVKSKRTEAAAQLAELAGNLARLEDIRLDLEPRLARLRDQAARTEEASSIQERITVLRGSLIADEWRAARDRLRQLEAQIQALARRLEEARAAAEAAEAGFARAREEYASVQERRLVRQQELGRRRLILTEARHRRHLAAQRIEALVEALQALTTELERSGAQREDRIRRWRATEAELAAAEAAAAALPPPPPPPTAPPPEIGDVVSLNREADRARSAHTARLHAHERSRARRDVLAAEIERVGPLVEAAEAGLPAVQGRHREAESVLRRAEAAAAELARAQAELAGIESLHRAQVADLPRVVELLDPEPGFEAALAAVLGSLGEAWVAPDRETAEATVARLKVGVVLYPEPGEASARPPAGSLAEHVRCRAEYGWLTGRLLGSARLTEAGLPGVTRDGVYREPGLVRAGDEPRVRLEARRRRLLARIAELEGSAPAAAAARERLTVVERELAQLAEAARRRPHLDQLVAELRVVEAELERAAAELPALQAELEAAVDAAQEGRRLRQAHEMEISRYRSALREHELEAQRWRERILDLRRRGAELRDEIGRTEEQERSIVERLASIQAAREAAAAELPDLETAVVAAESALAGLGEEPAGDDEELTGANRRLADLEEMRLQTRLRVGDLERSVQLAARERELTQQRMEELRSRLPDGMAPEEVPGGRARERELRQLERRLAELGPTNPLAPSELRELEQRAADLAGQLADIASARDHLEQLIGRLREEETRRYGEVFDQVAIGFNAYFEELSGGGRAQLRAVPAPDGQDGVDILVQPVRKRMQTLRLLSSGERAMTALALVLALGSINPSPFVILDEVDAALDDANVARFAGLLRRISRERQFLVITHNHHTMTAADTLYGIHLDESGCSHLVSARLDRVEARPAAGA